MQSTREVLVEHDEYRSNKSHGTKIQSLTADSARFKRKFPSALPQAE
jgi:hypothetical protein